MGTPRGLTLSRDSSMAERLFCKQGVVGSNPSSGSKAQMTRSSIGRAPDSGSGGSWFESKRVSKDM